MLLVISAGLLVRSLWRLSHTDPGFQAAQIVTARISPTESVCADPGRCLAFYRAFEAGLQGTAGITSAALVNTLPLTGAVAKRSLELEGFTTPGTQTVPLFWLHAITADYMRTMNIPSRLGTHLHPRRSRGASGDEMDAHQCACSRR